MHSRNWGKEAWPLKMPHPPSLLTYKTHMCQRCIHFISQEKVNFSIIVWKAAAAGKNRHLHVQILCFFASCILGTWWQQQLQYSFVVLRSMHNMKKKNVEKKIHTLLIVFTIIVFVEYKLAHKMKNTRDLHSLTL